MAHSFAGTQNRPASIGTPASPVRFPFSNRYVFAKVMHDNHALCKELIERVLGVEIERVDAIEVESEAPAIRYRGARFDVFLRGSDAAFEVEMQAYEQEALPLRMRYYRSQLDRKLLEKGQYFDALMPVYVIFICKDAPFGGWDLPVFTFRSTCEEDPAVPFDNGAVDVVLNAAGDLSKATPEVAELLRYVATGVAADSFTQRLQDAVDEAYEDEEWVVGMSMMDWDLRDARRVAEREGREAGMAAGLAEGEAKGLAEGEAKGCAAERERQASLIAAMTRDGREPGEILAALTGGELDEVYRRYQVA